mmetsp:Transcript_84867/g.205776  ORF Transcript_84867/g.205776 Transcript_84867/m.205776 type:complete len:705 (+) Transcript_84867:326-2440(+)
MPAKRKPGKKGAKGGGRGARGGRGAADAGSVDDVFDVPTSTTVVPEDQLQLTEKELDDDVTRVLTANDPNVPANIVVFDFKASEYKKLPPGPSDHVVFHFSMEGSAMHVNSEEAKLQVEADRVKREAEEERKKMSKAEAQAEGKYDKDMHAKMELMKVAKNQFNFSDRAAQTFNMGIRHKLVSTQPPLSKVFAENFTQWDIYDAYMAEFEIQQAQANAARDKASRKEKEAPPEEASMRKPDLIHSASMGRSLKILERMVNQNEEDEEYTDFKYWEDLSDQFRDGQGSLLPLWRFTDTRVKRKMVTGISWNPGYSDLLAVSYGNYDFMKQGSGVVAVYSLKNTKHPQNTFTLDSGALCLDFHPSYPQLLAVGCYDGSVKVFDVRKTENRPIFSSDVRSGKHTDPVWQVSWQPDVMGKDLNFFSVSSDGRVANWVMTKNELKMETVMLLKLVTSSSEEPDEETSLTGLAGGCCFDFNRMTEHLFIVGTEEGRIHKCSKAYSGQYLETYVGHHMAVYAVRWNPFHPRVFLSCSADWTVKLWDHRCPTAIMSFDVSTAVGDIDWAPYSSTVFACVTADGRVLVYDLLVNKHGALCNQKVVKKAKLTHVRFNQSEPILLAGDDKGGTHSLKLSPNLRKVTEPPKSDVPLKKGETAPPPPSQLEIEIAKVNALLASADVPLPAEEDPKELAAEVSGKKKGEEAEGGAGGP